MPLTKASIIKELNNLPGLKLNHITENYTFYTVNISIYCTSEIDSAKFFLDCQININIPFSYPHTLPTCYEVGEKKIVSYHHINPDKVGSFCLGTEMEIRYRLLPNYSIGTYCKLIIEYLTIYYYYKKYHIMPVIERSHGEKGILEGYTYLFTTTDSAAVIRLLSTLPIKNKHRNLMCPCGSNKKTKYCHYHELQKISKSQLLSKQANRDLDILKGRNIL
ncbi:hypothetical protein GCM10011482_12560 [Enterococcus alcedinis]|uniref:SEC-C domain-containing protein n=1 Tax=Enterococcus alcedinis TaxID=1274384 RepID=A0A917N6A8_9ENTE|nr:SEC-C domain-containing protein [Enterococcus alcedinis]MBP2102039.1 hypothetical protein [Enterococcus alcedinis]GGI65602.1 hypothetical protein GCM10011482_12560 [Enterococcus alcedinis]